MNVLSQDCKILNLDKYNQLHVKVLAKLCSKQHNYDKT